MRVVDQNATSKIYPLFFMMGRTMLTFKTPKYLKSTRSRIQTSKNVMKQSRKVIVNVL